MTDLIAAAHRAQADTLEIEAAAKRRLTDKYDAAKARGEVQRAGGDRTSIVADYNNAPTTAELGLRRDQSHDARLAGPCPRGPRAPSVHCFLRERCSHRAAKRSSYARRRPDGSDVRNSRFQTGTLVRHPPNSVFHKHDAGWDAAAHPISISGETELGQGRLSRSLTVRIRTLSRVPPFLSHPAGRGEPFT